MKYKSWWAGLWIWGLLFLTGCDQTVKYEKGLFKPDQASCWPCKMYMQAFDAIQHALKNALPIMCDNCLDLIKIGVPVWLLMKIIPWFVSLKEPEVKKDLRQIIIVLFKTLLVALLLSVKTGPITSGSVSIDLSGGKRKGVEVQLAQIDSSSGNRVLYDVAGKMFLQPIGEIFLGVSQMALATPSAAGISMSNYSGDSSGLGGSIISKLLGLGLDKLKEGIDKTTGGAFTGNIDDITKAIQGVYTGEKIKEDPMFGELPMKIQSMIWILYDALWSGMGLAFQLFQMNDIAAFISGILIFWALVCMMVKLPISFVEAVLYIGITVLLMPLYLLYWINPASSKDII